MSSRWFIPALALAYNATAALACPVCDSATGQEVRAGIFGADFASNLLAVVLPFAAVAAVVAAVHFGVPLRGTSHADRPHADDAN